MTLQQFSLSWEKHQSNICNGFRDFQLNGDFVDMTLAAEGHHVKVHKMMMGVASTYFRSLISTADTKHPIVFLHNISYETLLSLLEFIYTGEVAVQEDKLVDFINTAQKLQISGLLDMNEQGYPPAKTVTQVSPRDATEHKKAIDAMDPLAGAGLASEQPPPRLQNIQETMSPKKPIYIKTAQGRLIRRMTNIGGTTVKMPASASVDQKIPTFGELLQRANRKRSATSPIRGLDENRALSPITTCDEVEPDADDGDQGDLSIQVKEEPTDLEKLKVQGLQYTLSNRGAYQVILNRFIYNLYNKTRTNAHRWRCVEYRDNRCLACVITDKGVVVRRMNMHNHVFHDKKILNKMQKNIVVKTMEELEEVKIRRDIEVQQIKLEKAKETAKTE